MRTRVQATLVLVPWCIIQYAILVMKTVTYSCSKTDIGYKMHFDITLYMLLIFIQVLVHAVIWPNNLITEFLCCDDGCHLKKYASKTPPAIRLASINIVIDKMHFKGHIDQWCHQNCNSYSFCELDCVSWLQTGHLPNILSLMTFKCFVLSLFLDGGESEQSLCMQ